MLSANQVPGVVPAAETSTGAQNILVLDDRVLLAFSINMPHSPVSLFPKLGSTFEPLPSVYYVPDTGHRLYRGVQPTASTRKTHLMGFHILTLS